MSRRALSRADVRTVAPAEQAGLGVGQLMSRARGSLLTSLDTELERFGLNSTQFIEESV